MLADGTVFAGRSFGADPPAAQELQPGSGDLPGAGEVVFNTAMSGYHEVLTDPSCVGQLVAMTYPHVGNYGDSDEWSELGPEERFQRPVTASGLIVRNLYAGALPGGRRSLHEFLRGAGVPGIFDIDTRGLTLKLRDEGNQSGVIVAAPADLHARHSTASESPGTEKDAATSSPSSAGGTESGGARRHALALPDLERIQAFLAEQPGMSGRNLVKEVGAARTVTVNAEGSPHIALFDCGTKANIIRELQARGCKVTVLPSLTTEEEVRELAPDALFVSNGPGDPDVLEEQVSALKGLVGTLPLYGICMGHQLLCKAAGARSVKMKFGHHGVNHPVRDEHTGRVFVTSQYHDFAVDEESLPSSMRVRFRNANDGTIEGVEAPDLRIRTTQFHPEGAPGPRDSCWVFDEFLESIEES